MMCAHILKTIPQAEKSAMHDRFYNRYKKGLNWALDHSSVMLVLMGATILLTLFLFYIVPKGFFPQQDTGRIMGSIQAEQDISFPAMKNKLTSFVKIIQQDPAVANVVGFIGNGTTNSGNMFISLKPLEQRKISSDGVINRLRGQLNGVSGAKLFMQSAQDLVIGGRQGNAQFQYTLSADNLPTLNAVAPSVLTQLVKLPGMADVNSDQLSHGLQAYVAVNRDTASRLGLTSQQIDTTLYDAFGQNQVSTMYRSNNQYHVVMEVAPHYWQQPQTLNLIYVNSPAGAMVPLSTVANFYNSSTLLSVNHQGQAPSATLSFNLLPNVALGDAVTRVQDAVTNMHLPVTIQGAFQGTAQAFQASLASEPYLILLALFAVYIVLGILYESFLHPITILSTLPSAGVGALLALLLTRTDLNIIALIGMILLIGIVKKNAIMMIDFALDLQRREKVSSREAIFQAAVMRFRPIMMTTMAAMLGALPLVLSSGVGSELRKPLGIAIIGGLILSQMLTLFTTPVIFLSLERIEIWSQNHLLRFLPWRRQVNGV